MNKALFRDVGNYTNWCGDILPEEMYFVYLLEFGRELPCYFEEVQALTAGEMLSLCSERSEILGDNRSL